MRTRLLSLAAVVVVLAGLGLARYGWAFCPASIRMYEALPVPEAPLLHEWPDPLPATTTLRVGEERAVPIEWNARVAVSGGAVTTDDWSAPDTERCGHVTDGYRYAVVHAHAPGTATLQLRSGPLDPTPTTVEFQVSA